MKKQFAVFGNPIEHSLSPQIHQRFAHQHKLDIAYSKRLSDDNNFKTDIAQFFDSGGVGCNVTMPLKELAFAMSEVLTEKAKRARAVNTLYLDDQSRLCGDNTDGGGLLRDLPRVWLRNSLICSASRRMIRLIFYQNKQIYC